MSRFPHLGRSPSMDFPPTIIVRSKKENPRKCSVLPLKDRSDLRFFVYPVAAPLDLGNYVRLAAEGPPLSAADRELGVLLLDGSWRAAGDMTRDFAHVPPR